MYLWGIHVHVKTYSYFSFSTRFPSIEGREGFTEGGSLEMIRLKPRGHKNNVLEITGYSNIKPRGHKTGCLEVTT